MKYFVMLFTLFISTQAFSQNFWQATSGPKTARPTAVTTNAAGTIYVGTPDSGVYISTDNGSTWTARRNGLNNAGTITALIVLPNGNLLAGMDSKGVYRSTDNGSSWTVSNAGLPPSLPVNAFVRATSGDVFLGSALFGTTRGVYRSTDNGQNWLASNTGINNPNVYALGILPNGTLVAGVEPGGIYLSVSNGSVWLQSNSGLADTNVRALAVSPTTGTIIAGTKTGLFRSSNSGTSWNHLTNANGLLYPSETFYLSVAAPNGTLYLGASKSLLLKSSNDGLQWSNNFVGSSPIVRSATVDKNNNVIVGTMSGVFRSTDQGSTWQKTSLVYLTTKVTSLACDSTGIVYAGTGYDPSFSVPAGVNKSTDNGASWTQTNFIYFPTISITNLSIMRSGTIYAQAADDTVGPPSAFVHRSTNGGTNWGNLIQSNFPQSTPNISSCAIYGDSTIFYAAPEGVYRTTNPGNMTDWSLKNSGLDSFVACVGIDHQHTLYAITANKGTYSSVDNGDTWTKTSSSPISPTCFAINWNNDLFVGTSEGIYRSLDNGTSWELKTTGMNAGTEIASIVINKQNVLYAGFSGGVYRSTNNGENWQLVNTGFPGNDANVAALSLDKQGFLYAGLASEPGGVFRSMQSTIGVNENTIRKISSSFEVYPNPVSSATTIRFNVPSTSNVSLKIVDMLGREIATLASGMVDRGEHEVEWDARGISNGMYSCVMTMNEKTMVGRIILSR